MTFKEKQITISLVVVHAPLRRGVFSLLNDLGFIVLSSYDNGKEMTRNFQTDGLPDVVLVDADNDESAALETVRWLGEHYLSVKVLAFSLDAEEGLIKPLLDNGAHGYVCKTAERSEFNTAIKTVVKKGIYFPPLYPWLLKRF